MREIKFRAWHKGYPETGHLTATQPQMIYSTPERIFQWVDEKQPIEVMQYTGLKDKNGKEIYEGDILLFLSGQLFAEPIHVRVEFSRGAFIYKSPTFNSHMANEKEEKFLVIGNIYENPELLSTK
jgi:uncharacterized phage protein (TIGR01671 family)